MVEAAEEKRQWLSSENIKMALLRTKQKMALDL